MDKINKLSLPATILIGSIILGCFYYTVESNKQASIEKQQRVKAEQDKKEYIAKRSKECYDYETLERKKWDNVSGSYYDESKDVCVVTYKTNEYKGVDCAEIYKDSLQLRINCNLGLFNKEF